jgi:hypothetical protein
MRLALGDGSLLLLVLWGRSICSRHIIGSLVRLYAK